MAAHAPAEVRRDQVLSAALKCFARRGYHATRMDDIVAEAGLSKGAIYHRFRGKEEIFLGVFDAYEAAVWRAWKALPQADVLSTLESIGDIVLDTVLQPRDHLQIWKELLSHATAAKRFARIYRVSRAQLEKQLRRGIDEGALAAVDVAATAALLTATMEGLLLQALVDPGFDARAAWRRGWPVLRAGLQPDRPTVRSSGSRSRPS